MLLVYLASYSNRDLINGLTATDIKRVMINENVSLSQFVKKDMQLFRHASEIIIERRICKENDSEVLELLEQFKLLYDTRIIMLCSGADTGFIKGLLGIEIFDVVTATEFEGLREEFATALSTGMSIESWYDRFPELRPAATQPPSQEQAPTAYDNAARISAACAVDGFTIAFSGAMPRCGTTRLAVDFASYIAGLGAKVAYIDPKGKILSALQDSFSCNIIEGHILRCHGIDFMSASPKGCGYNFIISDTPNNSKLWSKANATALCTTYSFFEKEAIFDCCKTLNSDIVIGNLATESDCQELSAIAPSSLVLGAAAGDGFFSSHSSQNAGIFSEITDFCIESAAERAASIDKNLEMLLRDEREELEL